MSRLFLMLLLVPCAILVFQLPSADARAPWTSDIAELQKRSDLVLVVDPKSERPATDEDGVVWPTTRQFLAPIVTRCDVVVVMKGVFAEPEFDLHHFRLDWDGSFGIGRGPQLIEFQYTDRKINVDGLMTTIHPVYLLFLKQNDAGHFVPVTGQEDSLYSAMQLHRPFPRAKAEP